MGCQHCHLRAAHWLPVPPGGSRPRCRLYHALPCPRPGLQVGGRSVVNKDITQYVEIRPEEDRFLRLLEVLGEW